MGVDHSSLLYAGWELTSDHLSKLEPTLAKNGDEDLNYEEKGDAIGALLGCRVVVSGSAYSGDFNYYLSVLTGGGRLSSSNHIPCPNLMELSAKFDKVRERAKSFGIDLGMPNLGAVSYVW